MPDWIPVLSFSPNANGVGAECEATTITNLSEDAHAAGVGAKRHHLEVETYTWEVLPGGGTPNIVEGITRELLVTKQLLWN